MRCIDHVFLMNEQQQKTKGEEKKRYSDDILSAYSVNQNHVLTGSFQIHHSSLHLLTHRGL